ncbi:MAG: Trk family potassium uptake protein [Firmicutes bacterium]|nr:Trk family potassium uptake protein [Bacillota bacterium]
MTLIGTGLLMLPVAHEPGTSVSLLDALFTATSAAAVTGLTVLDTGRDFTLFGQLVILVLIQLGGLGLMTTVTVSAVLLGWRIGIRQRLLLHVELNQPSIGGVVRLVRNVITFTLLLEIGGMIVLFTVFRHEMPAGKAMLFAAFHAVSAFCNAGFDLFGNSLQRFRGNVPVNLTIATLIVAGGLGFAVLQDVVTNRRWSRLSFHSRVVLSVSAVLTLIGFVGVLTIEGANPRTLGPLAPGERVLAAFFQSVTTRTAGFNTIATENLAEPTLFLFLILMFVGASPGSTGGGIKTTTLAVFLAVLLSAVRRKRDTELGPYRLGTESLHGALVVVTGTVLWIMAVTMILLISEGQGLLPTLFEVVSAMGTVGLSLGVTGTLSPLGKMLIIATMFIGRVGPIAIVLSLGQRAVRASVRRPERNLIVG